MAPRPAPGSAHHRKHLNRVGSPLNVPGLTGQYAAVDEDLTGFENLLQTLDVRPADPADLARVTPG
jgi:hypothetical protein